MMFRGAHRVLLGLLAVRARAVGVLAVVIAGAAVVLAVLAGGAVAAPGRHSWFCLRLRLVLGR